jgi:hypothetical protein
MEVSTWRKVRRWFTLQVLGFVYEFKQFDKVMGGLLAVPYSELQKKLEREKRDKAKHKKKQPTSTASSRAASLRTKREA